MSGRFNSPQLLRHIGTPPANPPSGATLLYAKADGLLYRKDAAGTETAINVYLPHTHPSTEVTGLGNAATRNIGTTAGTVAAGDDSRLTDSRVPLAHTHTKANITDFAHTHVIGDLPATLYSTTHLPEITEVNGLTAALALKAPLASPAFTGTPTGITKAHVGLSLVDNVAAASLRDRATHTGAQAISTVTGLDTALAGKTTPAYIASRGLSLVTNGTGLLGDNTNFESFTYDGSDAPIGARGSFDGPAGVASSPGLTELMPVDPTKTFQLDFQAKQKGTTLGGYLYGMLIPYDAYDNIIEPRHYMYTAGTLTTLAVALNPGDTTVTLTSSANWYGAAGTPAGTGTHLRTLLFWDYVDPGGKLWAENTYSRNHYGYDTYADGAVVGNVITLRAPWGGPAKAAGTKVSNGSSGGSYMYGGAINALVPKEWTTYSATITGVVSGGGGASFGTGWPQGVGQAKIGFLMNRQAAGPSDAASDHSVAAVAFYDHRPPVAHVHTTAQVTGLDTALGLKAPLAAPALTGAATLDGQAIVKTNDTRIMADQAAATASIRTIGTGALQAAAGNHGHALTDANITGVLAIAKGGTNSTAAPTLGGVTYGTGTALAHTAAGTSKQVLQSNGGAAPTWVTLDLTYLPDAWTKKAVKVATTANITLSGTQTIDGIALVAGDRVLVKNQTTTSQNGIYQVNAGAWTRVAGGDVSTEIAGATVSIDQGAQGGQIWTNTFKSTDVLGTTAMLWYKVFDSSALGVAGGIEPFIAAGTTAQYRRGDKTWQTLDKAAVGLPLADNTADSAKPVSTPQQTALNLKANLASPAFTGTVTGITATMVGAAPTVHTHTKSQITDFAHTHLWADLTDKPATFTPTIGATATTAVAGNDVRLTDARVPLAHNQAFTTITGTIAEAQLPARLRADGNAQPTGGDWNNALDTGKYSGSDLLNAPGGIAGWWQVDVHQLAANSQYIVQTANNLSTAGASGITMRRNRNAGVWSGWIRTFQTEAEVLTGSVSRQVYTTVVPTRLTAVAGSPYVEWVGTADPAASMLAGDSWTYVP